MLAALVGPTAVGKTELSLELALRLQAEIVSADSMQVYRGMDIGTAKPTWRDRERVRHHAIDVVDPSCPFSVADYERVAREALAEIRSRGRLPLLVGGTGLYVRAVVDGLGLSAPGPDWRLREELSRWADERGNHALHARLAEVDPITAQRLHPNDRRRVIRALEVYMLTGEPLSHFHARDQARRRQQSAVLVGLMRRREELYRRIDARVDAQLRQGLLSEVRGLLHRGFGRNIISLQALGYKEFLPYLAGERTLQECVRQLKKNTRQLAKRQLTWFRADQRIHWIHLDDLTPQQALDEAYEIIQRGLGR